VKVEVRLFATLASFLPAHGRAGAAVLELPEGSTVTEVTRCLGIPPDLPAVSAADDLGGHDGRR
jgi:hypothetical protein